MQGWVQNPQLQQEKNPAPQNKNKLFLVSKKNAK